MSLWRRETLCAGWEAGRLVLARRRGARVDAVEAIDAGAAADDDARLAQLAAALSAARPDALEVVVSDRFARYFVLERIAGIASLAELEAAAGVVFDSRFGEPAADWEIAFDLGPRDTAGLACALPRGLAAGLREVAARARVARLAIEPFGCACLRAHAAALPEDAWIAMRGDAQVTVARHARGGWTWLRSMADDTGGGAAPLVARERLRAGDRDEVPVFAIGDWPAGGDGVTRLDGRHWPGLPGRAADQARVALAGRR